MEKNINLLNLIWNSVKNKENFSNTSTELEKYLKNNYNQSFNNVKKNICSISKKINGCPSIYMKKLESARICSNLDSCSGIYSKKESVVKNDWIELLTNLVKILLYKMLYNSLQNNLLNTSEKLSRGFQNYIDKLNSSSFKKIIGSNF